MQRNVLPADPKPSHYLLKLVPDLSNFVFEGTVTIDFEAMQPVSQVVLNAAELNLHSAEILKVADESLIERVDHSSILMDEQNQRAAIPLKSPLHGKFKLRVQYSGSINDKMNGFYRSKYTVNNEVRYLGTTQFEAVDARRALPCWDEPAHKATFDVVIVVPRGMNALSNMPEKSRVPTEDGKEVVSFDRTPVMSTYLLAWTIGDMECVERRIAKHRGGETLVRVWATKGKIQQGHFALDVACRCLPFYEEFFDLDYPLPKQDLLAIPDFGAGAMENWGLITYRETALLCDESSSAMHRQRVAIVVCHELAHQWFGNLVTMAWWKELWLNESFATFVEYFACEKLFPEWEPFTQFVNDEMARGMELDGLRSSHPVEVDVKNAQEIDDIFDAISYCKGGSLIRMIVEYIGVTAFRDGMREYLKAFKYSNATTVDLWSYLGKAAKKDLSDIMKEWTGAQGYPVLHVGKLGNRITITQHRFLSTGCVQPEDNTTVWKVPLVLMTENQQIEVLLDQRTKEYEVPASKWLKVNAKQAAFCRVAYCAEMLSSIASAVQSQTLPQTDRLGLMMDARALSIAGVVDTVDGLKLAQSYLAETHFTVWCAVAALESDVRDVLSSKFPDTLPNYNQFCAKLYRPALDRLGPEFKASDSHLDAQLRALLLGRLSAAKDATTLAALHTMFVNREKAPIPADARGVVYAAEVANGGRDAWNAVRAIGESSDDAMEKTRCLRAIAFTKDEALLRETVEYSLSDAVRSQDILFVFAGLSTNPKGGRVLVDAIKQKWSVMHKKLPGLILGRMFKFAENLCDLSFEAELTAFWNTLDAEVRMAFGRSFQQGMEGLRVKAAWAARDAASIASFINSQ